MKFNFKQALKVSAFYLEKRNSFILKKKYFLSRTAKIDPKDGTSRPNFHFQWRSWWQYPLTNYLYIDIIDNEKEVVCEVEDLLQLAMDERKGKLEAIKVLAELKQNYDNLQKKYAAAETTIDKLRWVLR